MYEYDAIFDRSRQRHQCEWQSTSHAARSNRKIRHLQPLHRFRLFPRLEHDDLDDELYRWQQYLRPGYGHGLEPDLYSPWPGPGANGSRRGNFLRYGRGDGNVLSRHPRGAWRMFRRKP